MIRIYGVSKINIEICSQKKGKPKSREHKNTDTIKLQHVFIVISVRNLSTKAVLSAFVGLEVFVYLNVNAIPTAHS